MLLPLFHFLLMLSLLLVVLMILLLFLLMLCCQAPASTKALLNTTFKIGQFRCIRIQPKTIDLSSRILGISLWGLFLRASC